MTQPPLILPLAIKQEIIHHAAKLSPQEACGILGGKENVIKLFLPVTNELHSITRFRMNPQEQLNAFLQLESQNLDLLAIVHSHPEGPKHPSQTDMDEFSYPGTIYLITYQEDGSWKIKAYEIDSNKYMEIPILS